METKEKRKGDGEQDRAGGHKIEKGKEKERRLESRGGADRKKQSGNWGGNDIKKKKKLE